MTASTPSLTYRLPQVRNLVTALPGPESARLAERRRSAVAGGVGSSVPVYAADADGGAPADLHLVFSSGDAAAVAALRGEQHERAAIERYFDTSPTVRRYVEADEELSAMGSVDLSMRLELSLLRRLEQAYETIDLATRLAAHGIHLAPELFEFEMEVL